MPKVKTKKAIKKRFKLTGTGKLMRCKQGGRHILTKKSPKRKRQLKNQAELSPAYTKLYKSCAFV